VSVAAVAVSVASLAIVVVALAVLARQPRRAWRSAAEHSQGFWAVWITGWASGGLAVAVLAGPGGIAAAGLAAGCLVGSLQPSMIADLLDVRRLGQLRREQAWMPRPAVEPPLRPIVWRAPTGSRWPGAVHAHHA